MGRRLVGKMVIVQVISPVLLEKVGARAVGKIPCQQPVGIVTQKTQVGAVVVPVTLPLVILVEVGAQDGGMARTVRTLG